MIFRKHLIPFGATDEGNMYSFDMTDVYTMIPPRKLVLAGCNFLRRYELKKMCGLSISTT